MITLEAKWNMGNRGGRERQKVITTVCVRNYKDPKQGTSDEDEKEEKEMKIFSSGTSTGYVYPLVVIMSNSKGVLHFCLG